MSDLHPALVESDHPGLLVPANPVTQFTQGTTELVAEMFGILDSIPGALALAAPQIDVPLRIVVYSLPEGPRGYLINPVILDHSKHARPVTEGCLSFPDRQWRVRRFIRVTTVSVDHFGARRTHEWRFLGAQMVQHELEHLDGVLLPDVAVRELAR